MRLKEQTAETQRMKKKGNKCQIFTTVVQTELTTGRRKSKKQQRKVKEERKQVEGKYVTGWKQEICRYILVYLCISIRLWGQRFKVEL